MYTVTGGAWKREYTGLSTDVKPIDDVPNGSTFYAMDTAKLFMFDAENKKWIEQ